MFTCTKTAWISDLESCRGEIYVDDSVMRRHSHPMTAIRHYMPFHVGSNMAVSTAATDIITSRSIMLKDFLTSIFTPVFHIFFTFPLYYIVVEKTIVFPL